MEDSTLIFKENKESRLVFEDTQIVDPDDNGASKWYIYGRCKNNKYEYFFHRFMFKDKPDEYLCIRRIIGHGSIKLLKGKSEIPYQILVYLSEQKMNYLTKKEA